MTLGAWLDRGVQPTPGMMASSIGERRPLWDRLTAWLEATYGLEGVPEWADRESGWILRFRLHGRSLTTLSPNADGGFGALVVVGPSAWADVEAAPLSERTREMWRFAKPYPDGRWLWMRVSDDEIVDDIEHLLVLKAPPPKRLARRRVAGASAA